MYQSGSVYSPRPTRRPFFSPEATGTSPLGGNGGGYGYGAIDNGDTQPVVVSSTWCMHYLRLGGDKLCLTPPGTCQ